MVNIPLTFVAVPIALAAVLGVPSLIAADVIPFSVSAAVAAEDPVLFYRSPMGANEISKTPKKDNMGMDFIPVRRSTVAPLLAKLPSTPRNPSEEPLFWHDSMGMGEVSLTPKKDSMGMEMLPVRAGDIAGLLPPR